MKTKDKLQATASINVRSTQKAKFSYTVNTMDEAELIEGCKKGKRAAQSKLYNQYCGAMLNIAMRYCDNQSEAEDALQDAFVSIFKKIVKFEGRHEGSLTAWIKTIVVNAALSVNRKNKKHNYTSDVSELKIADHESFDQTFSDDYDSKKKFQLITDAVKEMPTGYRTVFNLYVMEGYSHQEIAEILEVTESTSKSQLSKARKYLKTKLGIHN